MDEHKIELLLARTERHDKMLEDHSDRLIKLETHAGADYEWRKKIDENLGTINAKLETLLTADGNTYSTVKIAAITAFVSAIIGYAVKSMLG